MIGRTVRRSQKPAGFAELAFEKQSAKSKARNRRITTAFLTGAGLLALALGPPEAGIAAELINLSNEPVSFVASQVQNGFSTAEGEASTPKIAWSSLEPGAGMSGDGIADARQGPSSLPRRSVCVRLCDGYYFPVGPLSRLGDLPDHEAACSGQCPDAPTQLYVEPAGSDRIEDAVSSDGARYGALPVAFRNRTTLDNTCTCHRRPGQALSLLNDSTLRKGDSIMTPAGIVVFRGAGRSPYAQDDFTTLADASIPKDKREILAAIERAALPNIRQSGNAPPPPHRSEIAFNAPASAPSRLTPISKSIHFVEPIASSSD